MSSKANMFGIVLLGWALTAHAYTSPYTSMAVAGGAFTNEWSTTPNLTLIADNTWQGIQEVTAASGEFKFAANDAWTISWGGSASIARVPAAGSTVSDGGNLAFANLTPGLYQFTFNDSTLEFQIEWAGGSPLPIASITNMALVGDFNSWTPSGSSILTNNAANTNLWSGSVDLQTSTAFQFRPNSDANSQWGAPESTSISVTGLGLPLTNSACGQSDYTLTSVLPGTFEFALNTSNATFTITQTATQAFTISTMTAQGSFVATDDPPANMMQIGETLWQSDHTLTNNGTVTLRFSANSGVRIWGATNATPSGIPVSGTMETGLTTYAQMTGVVPGRYRINFDHQTGVFSFRQLYAKSSGLNLLDNPGFENTTEPTGGDAVDWGHSQSWPKRVADGNQYLPHSGNWCGAIHGQWFTNWNDYASFAQDVLVTEGKTYRASAWFKATDDWTADQMQVKVEWLDATNGPVGDPTIEIITTLTDYWIQFVAEGAAPAGATKAHVVFLCAGSGTTGTMQVDDAEMRSVASRTQNFDTWGELTDFAAFAPDWSVTSGKTVYNVPPGRPPAAVMISQYIEGTGNNKAIEVFNGTLSNLNLSAGGYYLQQYNNGSLSASVSIALTNTLAPGTCLVIGRQDTPTNYAPDSAISDLDNLMTNKYITFNGDDVIVLRNGGPFGTVIDRVGQVGTNATGSIWSRNTTDRTLTRKSTIFTGTTTSVQADFPLLDEWDIAASDTFTDLGTHELSFLDPNEPYTPAGYSLILNSGATLMSGDLPDGIGDVSFWFRTESMSPELTLVVETAISEAGPWTNAATLTDIASSNFSYYAVAVNRANHTLVRFRQTDGGTNRFRIDEITVSEPSDVKRLEDFAGWTDPAYETPGSYSRYGWTIQDGNISPTTGVYGTRAGLISPPNGSVLTPAYQEGVGEVIFWTKAHVQESPAYLLLQTTIDGGTNWVTQGSFTASTGTSYTTWLYLTNNPTQARIIFDPAEDSGDALLDNINIRVPALYRNQTFDGWPYKSSYTKGTTFNQGWEIHNCIVDAQISYSGMAARLNTVTDGSAWIEGPYLPDGIGSISYRMRKRNDGDTSPSIQVQVSANGVGWTTIATHTATSTNYAQFQLFWEDTTNHFVRFVHSAGVAAVPIDDIRIGSPQPRPEVAIAPNSTPEAPSSNDTVQITADVVTRYGASILSVTSWYKVNFGPWIPVAMTPVAYGSYASVDSIDAQAAGIPVRYYVVVQYAGIGAAPASTGYTTNTATSITNLYQISSIAQGDVWINELAYLAYDEEFFEEDHEFIELCGVAGADISGWTIELAFGADADIVANSNQPLYATYPIPIHTFTNQTNGFSFYVLGDQQLLDAGEPIDEVLTTLVPPIAENWGYNHIADSRGVIRLLNEYGNLVYSLSYAGSASGSDPIPTKQVSADTNSVNLGGSGSSFDQFTTWDLGAFSIGKINSGQTLIPRGDVVLAEVWHIPAEYIIPVNTNVAPFYMRDPLAAQNHDPLGIHYGYATTNYPLPNGTLYYRQAGYPSWDSLPMSIRSGSADSNGDAYVAATIPTRTFTRGTSIEYVMQANPNETGISTAYIGGGTTNDYELFETLSEAQATPFAFTYAIRSDIFITNMTANATSWVLNTMGNDIIEPFTNFKVEVNTNALTQYRYIYSGTNIVGLTNNSSWGSWVSTNFTATPIDAFGQNTFTVPKGSEWPKAFYRITPLWP